jgi:ABC-2 type transport system ATP-binding protein
MSIKVEHLSKKYGSQYALNNISFAINSGEILGFIGPNGAGKSTLMKIMCALLSPTSGTVKLNGQNVELNSVEIKRFLGYLPENNPLYPDLYVKEYLLHIARFYHKRKFSQKRVDEVVGLTGLSPEMHKKINVLSKGYRQRVGLAQAIIHDPKILILDEPTTGLDPNQIIEIRALIKNLGKDKTVILSTHLMQEVEAICDRVIIIDKGQLVADDYTGKLSAYSKSQCYTIIVEFDNDTDQVDFTEFPDIGLVKKIRTGTWLIETTGAKDIRSDLFNYAVKRNLIILSLHRKDKKLEDVFRELTS